MGYLGLGSTLSMLGIPYGSEEAIQFTDEVTKVMALESWRSALKLSMEKGPAPIMEEEFEVTGWMLRHRPEMVRDGYAVGDKVKGKVLHARYSRYMQRIAGEDPELVEQLAEHGARYSHATSIAPTGTISFSVGNNASNGIEPSFLHHTQRNIIRQGKSSKEAVDVYSFELLAYRYFVNPEAGPEDLPESCVTADRISVREHVLMQAAAQKWIDSAISKTINVPEETPFEEFKDVYMMAYEHGLKGCTTFRPNSKAAMGVLVDPESVKKQQFTFVQDDGQEVTVSGDTEIEYDGETHTAANLFAAMEEGYYGKL